jgi:hypothetical protein
LALLLLLPIALSLGSVWALSVRSRAASVLAVTSWAAFV